MYLAAKALPPGELRPATGHAFAAYSRCTSEWALRRFWVDLAENAVLLFGQRRWDLRIETLISELQGQFPFASGLVHLLGQFRACDSRKYAFPKIPEDVHEDLLFC